MKKLNKLITILFLAVLCACNSDDDNKPNDGVAGWEFLKIGNKWTYKETNYSYNSSSTYTEEITSIKEENKDNCQGYWIYFGNDGYNDLPWFANNEYFSDLSNSGFFGKWCQNISIYRNSSAGQKWTNTDGSSREVRSINATVTVPAGTFHNCVHIIERNPSYNPNFYANYYFSYKYGFILREYYFNDKLNRKIELIALGDYIPPEEPETSTPVGQFTWTEWKQKAGWEDYSASDYTPNAKILDSLKQVIDLNEISFILFGANWCIDSKFRMPRIMKLLQEIGYEQNSIDIYGLNKTKTEPAEPIAQYSIKFIPTLIILKNDIEIGKIIGSPIESWEKHILLILTS